MSKTKITGTTKAGEERKYGLASLVAMIVGIVIGAGSFVKNQRIMDVTNSTIAGYLGWILAAFMVVCMTISFVEIASITKHSKETGSLTTWGEKLVGKNFAKYVGFSFMFVYIPVALGWLATNSGNQIFNAITAATGETYGDWMFFGINTAIALFFILFFFGMNILSNKFGKVFQQVAASVLLTSHLIIIGFMMFSMMKNAPEAANIWDRSKDFNNGLDGIDAQGNEMPGRQTLFTLILQTMPALMFAFDGFLFSSSLQSEAKTEKTYRQALTIGTIIFIVLELAIVYGLFSYGAHMHQITEGEYSGYDRSMYGVIGVLTYLFGSHAKWAVPVVAITILLSVLSSLSGMLISTTRYMPAMSEQNQIVDADGGYLKRGKSGIPMKGTMLLFYITMAWFILLTSLDAINLHYFIKDSTGPVTNTDRAIDYVSELSGVTNYVMYAVIMIGAIGNRSTQKYKSDKINGWIWWPNTILGIIIPILVSIYVIWFTISLPFYQMADNSLDFSYKVEAIINVVMMFITLSVVPISIFVSNKYVREAKKKVFRAKKPMVAFYHTNAAHPEYGGDQKFYNKFMKEYGVKKDKGKRNKF